MFVTFSRSPAVLPSCSVPPPWALACCFPTPLWRFLDQEETVRTRCRSLVSPPHSLMGTWGRIPGTAGFLVSRPVFLWCCQQSPRGRVALPRRTRRAPPHVGKEPGSGGARTLWLLPYWKTADAAPRAAAGGHCVWPWCRRRTRPPWLDPAPGLGAGSEETRPGVHSRPGTVASLEGSTALLLLLTPDWPCQVWAERSAPENWEPQATPAGRAREKTCVEMTAAKSELWSVWSEARWAARSCWPAPPTTRTGGSVGQTQGGRGWPEEEGLCSTLWEGCRIRTLRRRNLRCRRTWSTMNLHLQEPRRKDSHKQQGITAFLAVATRWCCFPTTVYSHLGRRRVLQCRCLQAGCWSNSRVTAWSCRQTASPGWTWEFLQRGK